MFLGEVRVFLTNYWIGLKLSRAIYEIRLVDLIERKVATEALS